MPSKQAIHVSDLRTFLQCRLKWDWSSLMRQGLEKKSIYAPFFTGRGIHWCLQMYYEQGANTNFTPVSWVQEFVDREVKALEELGTLWRQEEDLINQQVQLMTAMLEHYSMWQETDVSSWRDDNLQFIALETEFNVPLYTPTGHKSSKINIGGRFDGVVKRLDHGTYWLFETKTARSIDQLTATLNNDQQAGVYIIAAQRMLGVPIAGVLYNILRKKEPTRPQVLQNGQLSQRSDADTTAWYYLKAINEQHPEWNGNREKILSVYGNQITNLLNNAKPFFMRVPITRTASELEELERVLWLVGKDMTKPTIPIYPNASWWNCQFCQFKAPCLAKDAGADFGAILHSEYRERRQWDELEGKEDNNGQDVYTR